jgi:hypothetical protein
VRTASSPCRIVLIALLALTACGGGGSEASRSSSADEDAAAAHKEKPVAEQGKKWGGWRWKGRRQDCFFRVANECHSTLEEACKAAGCGKSDCVHDDGAPAKVSCEN